MATTTTDLFELSAQATTVLQKLHQRNDVVVRLRSDRTGVKQDELTAQDKAAPGHFRVDTAVLNLNLDDTVALTTKAGRTIPLPKKLDSVKDWVEYPVLAGVSAHECGHARFTRWLSAERPLPKSIELENPDDPDNPEQIVIPESGGRIIDIAKLLEEPRIERLGVRNFPKVWRVAMQHSARHFVLEQNDKDGEGDVSGVQQALGLMILVGGRRLAGTLGATFKSRELVNKLLDVARRVIDAAYPDNPDVYDNIMDEVREITFCDEHDDPVPYLTAAVKILKLLGENPEDGGGSGSGGSEGAEGEGEGDSGSGGGEGEGENPEGSEGDSGIGKGALDPELEQELKSEMAEALDKVMGEMRVTEETHPDELKGEAGGHGSVIYSDPKAPKMSHTEKPNAQDRELYHRARAWLEAQNAPTVTECTEGSWLPVGGSRLNIRSYVRDNLASKKLTDRSDWDRITHTVEAAPPVKVGIMLDGSGSMWELARPSASIAWAVANAAADLPESRTASVVYGSMASLTQPAGHRPVAELMVSNTDGPTENFGHASELISQELRLNEYAEPVYDDSGNLMPSNVLIVVVSDLRYGGRASFRGEPRAHQLEVFNTVTSEWIALGHRVIVIAPTDATGAKYMQGKVPDGVEVVPADFKELFR